MSRGRWQSKFSSWSHQFRKAWFILTHARKTAPRKLGGRPKWILFVAGRKPLRRTAEICQYARAVLHSTLLRLASLGGRTFQIMVQKARLRVLGILVLCGLLFP